MLASARRVVPPLHEGPAWPDSDVACIATGELALAPPLAQAERTSSTGRSGFSPRERLPAAPANRSPLARCRMSSHAGSHRRAHLASGRGLLAQAGTPLTAWSEPQRLAAGS